MEGKIFLSLCLMILLVNNIRIQQKNLEHLYQSAGVNHYNHLEKQTALDDNHLSTGSSLQAHEESTNQLNHNQASPRNRSSNVNFSYGNSSQINSTQYNSRDNFSPSGNNSSNYYNSSTSYGNRQQFTNQTYTNGNYYNGNSTYNRNYNSTSW